MSDVGFPFRGLMAPVFTPFDENKICKISSLQRNTGDIRVVGSLVKSGLLHLLTPQWISYAVCRHNPAPLAESQLNEKKINGTTGEGVSLTATERKDVLECWMKAGQAHNQTVMVQIGGTDMQDVKYLARHAEESKVSSILCLADLFFRPSNVDELIHYLKIVSAEAPNTPLLYYHIPSFTGINKMAELIERSGEIPTFVGIKFTDNDLVQGSDCISKSSQQKAVFLGCDHLFLSALVLGFDSAIGTTINIFPQHNFKILRYFKEKRLEDAAAEQNSLNQNIRQIVRHGSWVSSMKAAMRLLTPIEVGPVREPLINVTLQNSDLNLR